MKRKILLMAIGMPAGIILSGYYGPWWAPAGFIVLMTALSGLNAKQAAVAGAASLSLVYMGLATALNLQDETGILRKTGALLGHLSPNMLILITTFLATVTGALAGWLGSALGSLLMPPLPEKQKPDAT